MCGCKDCQGITLLKGTDGVGIVSITAQEDGTFVFLYSDGTTYTSPDLTGPQGIQGIPGPAGTNGTNGTDGVIILHSEYVHDNSTTTGAIETLGNPLGYTLADWDTAPADSIYEMEFDFTSNGASSVNIGGIAFYLNGSNTYIPALVLGNPILPLLEDGSQALNVKITLTNINTTTGYVSLIATRSPGGTSVTPTIVFGMSKTIVLAGGVVDALEVQVKVVANPITLERVIIKQINP
jgi:hypothetical protein